MKKGILLLLASLLFVACDDFLFTDGITVAEGYVLDERTGQRVPNAKVLLVTCQIKLFSQWCDQLLDSTRTNADGYYRFRFKDRRKTDFGVRLADYLDNTVYPLPLTTTTGHDVVDDTYVIREGEDNRFDFFGQAFTTLPITIRLRDTGYQDASLWAPFESFSFPGRANSLDTTLRVKALPEQTCRIGLRLSAPGQAEQVIEQEIYVEEKPTQSVIFDR